MTGVPIERPLVSSVGGPSAIRPSIAVILPAYNEADRIDATLRSIAGYLSRLGVEWPVFLADDGSTDGTAAVAVATAAPLGLPLQVVGYPHRGKALTVRDTMLKVAATNVADYCLMLDADDELRIDQLDHVRWADEPTIYIGRRVSETNGVIGARPPLLRRAMSAGMRFSSRVLLGLGFPDTQCGFKLFPSGLIPQLFGQQRSAGWVFDAELLVIAWRISGIPVREVPVTWSPRGKSKVTALNAVRSVFSLMAVAFRYRTGRYRKISLPPDPS